MRTNISSVGTNGNGFGCGQDRVVSSQVDATYAHAAQHLESWHVSKSAHGLSRKLKRRDAMVMAGAAPGARMLNLAITGPQGRLTRHTSPALVKA